MASNGKAREQLEDLVEDVKETAQAVRDKADEYADKTLNEIFSEVKGYIKAHPVKAAAIAVGCGVIAGLLLRNGTRSSD